MEWTISRAKMKSYRVNAIMQKDLDCIKEALGINETAAIMWALRIASDKIKGEYLHERSSD